MKKTMSFEAAMLELGPVLESKVQELHLLGYDTVTLEGLWSYLVVKRWKKEPDEVRLHDMVSHILTVKPGDIMNFLTQTEYKAAPLALELNEEELHYLLHGKGKDSK